MARLVVIEFSDNEAAEKFVRRMSGLDKPEGSEQANDAFSVGSLVRAYGEVVRVVAKPTIFCTCGDPRTVGGGWAKSKKYGWMVHKTCAKPTVEWGSKIVYLLSVKDLLPEILPKKWEVDIDGEGPPSGGLHSGQPTED